MMDKRRTWYKYRVRGLGEHPLNKSFYENETSTEMGDAVGHEAVSGVDQEDAQPIGISWFFLHCIGFGSCWAWVHVSFFSSVLASVSGTGAYAWLANLLANGLAMVTIGLMAKKSSYLNRSRAFVSACMLTVALGTLVLAFMDGILPTFLWYLCGPIFTGIGTAGLLLLWAEAYMSISPFTAKKYTLPGAMLTGVLVYLLIVSLPHIAGVVLTAALPVVSILCLKMTYPTPDPAPVERPSQRVSQAHQVIRFLLIIAVYCIAAGFMDGRKYTVDTSNFSSLNTTMFAGIALLLILVTILSIVLMKRGHEDFMYRMIVPLMAAGLLIMPFFAGGASSATSNIAIMGGYIIMEMFVWSALQNLARHATEQPAFVYGIGKSGMNLGLLAGTLLGMFAATTSTMIMVGISVVIVYVFILLGAFTPSGYQRSLLTLTDDGTTSAVTISPAPEGALLEDARRSKCRELAKAYGLSQREEDVLFLISSGRSISVAADTLGIAPSTVKSHKDHIYQKLGIHSKEDLLDMMDER